ncbi:HAD superfamily hydrolase (TIGR01484 family) [Haloactinopolyspora alba]|uniref:HAD superfamily hydrolase (TIGR01484 family) n=1 Tax=Haloactinopolyspora alba TaxID=648780 RepID=A0A2P8E6W9_9ACTN|nr:HAD family hydrolase [Haloactinopolyspora alba]PSL05215.1 HAD superfamily hydrolase (TIGR01484 family) [Haloactinopolyspora alba]
MSGRRRRRPTLVALDLDGTVVGYEGFQAMPTEAVTDAVRRVTEAGSHVVVATGRSVHSTVHLFEPLGLKEGFAVCSNGAVIVDVATGEPVHVETFDVGDPVRYFTEQVPDALLAVEELGRGFRVTGEFPVGELEGEVTVVDHDDLIANPVTRLVVRWPDGDRHRLSEIAAQSGLRSIDYAIGYSAWLDIMPAGVTKASGLRHVAQRLDVAAEDALAVGDGHNDLEMLTWAGLGVAMGQSADDVKAVADEVCGDVTEDGLAGLLERFFPPGA